MTDKDKERVINKWLEDNYNQLKINVHKVCGYSQAALDKWGNDIIPYVWEAFRKMPLDKQYQIITEGNPENYLTRGMALSIKSSTSMFYNTYRKFSKQTGEVNLNYHDREDKTEINEANFGLLEEAVSNLDFYNKFLITKYYYENKSAAEIAEVTGIAPSTVGKDIRKALQKLKDTLGDKVEF